MPQHALLENPVHLAHLEKIFERKSSFERLIEILFYCS